MKTSNSNFECRISKKYRVTNIEYAKRGIKNLGLPLLAACFLLLTVSSAQEKFLPHVTPSEVEGSQSASSSAGNPRYQILNINNLTTWHRSDGHSNHSPGQDNGVYYPLGTGNIIYQDCFVWGGKVYTNAALTAGPGVNTPGDPSQPIRIGGGTYGIGTRAGAVSGFGVNAQARDPNSSQVHIFRIRRDYTTMTQDDYKRDARSYYEHGSDNDVTQSEIDQLRSYYEADWLNWPVSDGAPFIDRNGNGVYDPPPVFNTDPEAGPLFTAESLITQNRDEPGLSGQDTDLPADQVLWTVYNDLDEYDATSFLGSLPLGLEIQKTVWGYRRNDALSNLYLVRYVIINKGGVDTSDQAGDQLGSFWIDSMYVAQWSDPDLGSFTDDLVGCDTSRGLAYVYNYNEVDATFRQFSIPPPSGGYDFLAGPAVPSPGDSAIVNFQRRHDWANRKATSFSYFSPGTPYGDPPRGADAYFAGSGQWWHMLRGYAPIGDFGTPPQPYAHPPGMSISKFPFSGDPLTQTGWVDGMGTNYSPAPYDRRFLMSTGPFRMAPGDTQEVYVGFVVGLGADRLSSISVMKYNDDVLQTMFDNVFRVPYAPADPVVHAIGLDREIILEWGGDATARTRTEDKVIAGMMVFEGYNVYQLPSADSKLTDAIKLATYDVKNGIGRILEPFVDYASGVPVLRVAQEGPDEGLRRSLRLTVDRTIDPDNQYGRDPFVNGKEYYFAVTAYSRNVTSLAIPAALESPLSVVTVKPRIPFGERPTHGYGDTISVSTLAGASGARVYPIVVDPLGGTGHTYRMTFTGGGPLASMATLTDVDSGAVVFSLPISQMSGEASVAMTGGVRLEVVDLYFALGGSDEFEFTIPASEQGSSILEESADRIGVFPNPYYARNEWATSSLKPFVTFNNLPQKAVIRIYNLAGHLVRTLHKDSDSQFFEWDLRNEHSWLVASGMYICLVEMPELRLQKIVKLAVIQENPIPN